MKRTESGKIFLMLGAARRYSSMTREELAERIGVSVKVANALEVPVDFLTGRLEGSEPDRLE